MRNRPGSPDNSDPDGTETVSRKEWDDKVDQMTRDIIGEKKRDDKDPEGTEGDRR